VSNPVSLFRRGHLEADLRTREAQAGRRGSSTDSVDWRYLCHENPMLGENRREENATTLPEHCSALVSALYCRQSAERLCQRHPLVQSVIVVVKASLSNHVAYNVYLSHSVTRIQPKEQENGDLLSMC
jgi:hypothetical protein